MTEQKRTVEEFIGDLEKFSFDEDKIAININLLLEAAAEALGGKLSHWYCSDKNTEHHKIVIEYGNTKKNR
jgi:hypothetical protein